MGSTESALLMDDTDENGRHNQDHGDQSNNSNNGAIVSNANVGVQNEQDSEDQWWWEIENENLLLDVAPSLLSEQASSLCSSVSLSENFQNRKIQNDESETAEASSIVSANVATAPSIFDESESSTNHRQHERVKQNSTTTYREQTLEEFREELQSKRIARKNAIQELRTEISTLRQQLASEKETSRRLRNGETVDEHESVECVPDVAAPSASSSFSGNANIELADTQLALQSANADNISLRTEVSVVRKQVVSLKEVVACCKQMISVKDEQCMQLKNKLRQIEESLAERELKIMSDQLRQEYDRQLENIRTLRQLYEDRQRVSAAERENLERQIAIKKDELIAEQERRKDLEEGNHALKKEIENLTTELASLKEERNEYKFENKALNEEMGVVNNLFSQMLMGFNGTNNLDIDRLTEMLEENRTLLNDMATKELNCSDGATLPKLLFELVQQATISNNAAISDTDSIEMERSTMEEDSVRTKSETSMKLKTINSGEENVASAKEIIGNLPKVWKVLMELLSHHKIEQVDFKENGHSEDCYKYVETCNGQKTELSVSKTYLKLKDLILEKKSLVKETNRLKTLNCHLEYRLNEQEKRLSAVSLELTKTWHLVGKMQRQHRQLHTQEQILRYQLQQKRRLLNELKDELEYCRRKWAAARAKNDESQVQCDDLRREFAKRKLEDANINSAESGYSDCSVGPGSDEDDASRRCAATGTGGGGGGAAAAGDDDEDVDDDDGGDDSIGSAGTSHRTNEKHKTKLSEMFEHARKIKRMQSTSPGRANYRTGDILLRWNSAPPAMGCSPDDNLLIVCDNNDSLINDERAIETRVRPSTGTIPKDEGQSKRASRSSKVRCHKSTVDDGLETRSDADDDGDGDDDDTPQTSNRSKRATRIQRLEEQCKSLITQLLQTSDNRERLEVQLCRFQKEIAPVQYAIPLDEFISRKSLERFTRASSMPTVMNSDKSDNGSLTAREQEYTRKRSERLERLEEESRQLMSRIRKTSDRGNNLGSLLERIHSNQSKRHTTSRDASCESTTEEIIPQQPEQILAGYEAAAVEDGDYQSKPSPLSAEEEVYTTRRADRLKRLENESKQLLSKLSCNTNRGKLITSKLDSIHKKYGRDDDLEPVASCSKTSDSISSPTNSLPTIEKRIENMTKISINRDERLRILEEEGKQLIARLSSTAERGADIINRITEREQIRHIHQSGRQAERKTTIDDSNAPSEDSPIITTSALLPTPKTVACTSIVSEEITERVTITRVPSQIDNSQGAVPKLKSTSQLCAAKSNRFTARRESEETLEEMVNRLRNLPFPDQSKEEKDISK